MNEGIAFSQSHHMVHQRFSIKDEVLLVSSVHTFNLDNESRINS